MISLAGRKMNALRWGFIACCVLLGTQTGCGALARTSSSETEKDVQALVLVEPERTYYVGGVVLVERAPVDEGTPFTAYVAGIETPVAESGDTLTVLLPEVASGLHTLSLHTPEEIWEADVSIENLPLPADPRGYVTTTWKEFNTIVTAMLATAAGDQQIFLEHVLERLSTSQESLETLSDEAVNAIARTLLAMEAENHLYAAAPYQSAAEWEAKCDAAMKAFPAKAIIPRIIGSTLSAAAWSVAWLAKTVGFVEAQVADKTLAIQSAYLADKMDILDKCIAEPMTLVLKEFKGNANAPAYRVQAASGLGKAPSEAVYEFRHGVARTFLGQLPGLDPSLRDDLKVEIDRLFSQLEAIDSPVQEFLGTSLPEAWGDDLFAPSRSAKAADFRLVNISDPRVKGTVTGEGDQLTLTFRFADGVESKTPVPFTFSLESISRNEVAGTYSATLKTGASLITLRWNEALMKEEVARVDAASGSRTVLGYLGDLNYWSMRAVLDPKNRTVYAVGYNSADVEKLYAFHLTNNTSTALTVPGIANEILSGTDENGDLITLRWNSDLKKEEVVRLNVESGASVVLGYLSDLYYWGCQTRLDLNAKKLYAFGSDEAYVEKVYAFDFTNNTASAYSFTGISNAYMSGVDQDGSLITLDWDASLEREEVARFDVQSRTKTVLGYLTDLHYWSGQALFDPVENMVYAYGSTDSYVDKFYTLDLSNKVASDRINLGGNETFAGFE